MEVLLLILGSGNVGDEGAEFYPKSAPAKSARNPCRVALIFGRIAYSLIGNAIAIFPE
jgi:hypothetical protein